MQHDKSRDRRLTAAGWRVMRFTGSEVYRDAAACVAQVRESRGRMGAELLESSWRSSQREKQGA